MRAVCLYVVKNRSVLDPTTSARRTAFGRSSVRWHTLWSFFDRRPSLWIAWLNIIAAANEQDKSGKLWGIREILNKHYAKYGRSFFSRYDYEEVPSDGAQKLVDHVNELIKSSSFSGKSYTSSATGTSFNVAKAYNFDYTDPIDKSVSKNQGQVVTFSDGSRVVWRLSGTGSQGATVRMYVERYVAPDAGEGELSRDAGEGLQALIDVALDISNLKQFLGREQPTVITVSIIHLFHIVKWIKGILDFSDRGPDSEDIRETKSDGIGVRCCRWAPSVLACIRRRKGMFEMPHGIVYVTTQAAEEFGIRDV
jgi:hypothetical protein